MPKQEHSELKDTSDLFSKEELKKFFSRYLIVLGVIEIFIFFVSFLSILEPYPSPFPWRSYFYAAFTIPIGITFLLGLIIVAFNNYFFKESENSDELKSSIDSNVPHSKVRLFLNLSSRFQFIIFLLALSLSGLMLFHMDDLLSLIANAGEKAFYAILIIISILMVGAISLGIVYLWLNYKLREKRMDFDQQNKMKLMTRNGLLIPDDSTVVEKRGIINRIGCTEHCDSFNNDDDEENTALAGRKVGR
jgi:hypothetical protein